MKKLLLGTVALAALGMGAPAVAADMRARPLARPPAYTNWTGCYIGGSVGNEWGHSDGYSAGGNTVFSPSTGTHIVPGTQLSNSFDMTGFTGGVYGGCNYQFGVWVVGAEGDWEAMNKEGQAFFPGGPSTSTVPLVGGGVGVERAGAYFSAKERWLATARGRLGYALDKYLFFVSGGAAWMKIESSRSHTFFPGTAATVAAINLFDIQSDVRTGWTVGGGVEYMLPYNWIIRSEYLYVQIPSYTTFTPGIQPVLGQENVIAGKLNNHILRAGLAYKFF
jgi:outer membrane immunogenic protein